MKDSPPNVCERGIRVLICPVAWIPLRLAQAPVGPRGCLTCQRPLRVDSPSPRRICALSAVPRTQSRLVRRWFRFSPREEARPRKSRRPRQPQPPGAMPLKRRNKVADEEEASRWGERPGCRGGVYPVRVGAARLARTSRPSDKRRRTLRCRSSWVRGLGQRPWAGRDVQHARSEAFTLAAPAVRWCCGRTLAPNHN